MGGVEGPESMDKTDRQTDTRSTWWCVTAYNDDICLLENTATWPSFVAKVYGGREECPTTGRLHFQGAVQCAKQQRFSAIKNWLKTAHIEVAKSKEALAKYAMKEDTAVGPKLEVENPYKYYTADMLALLMAQQIMHIHDDLYIKFPKKSEFREALWSEAFNGVLRFNDKLFGQMMNPSFKSAWFTSLSYWISKARGIIVLEVPDASKPV